MEVRSILHSLQTHDTLLQFLFLSCFLPIGFLPVVSPFPTPLLMCLEFHEALVEDEGCKIRLHAECVTCSLAIHSVARTG